MPSFAIFASIHNIFTYICMMIRTRELCGGLTYFYCVCDFSSSNCIQQSPDKNTALYWMLIYCKLFLRKLHNQNFLLCSSCQKIWHICNSFRWNPAMHGFRRAMNHHISHLIPSCCNTETRFFVGRTYTFICGDHELATI